MTNKYKYSNQDIYNLLNSTGTSNSGPYIGFPITNLLTYKSGIAFPQLLNYQVNGTDLSNTNQAYSTAFSSSFGGINDKTYNFSRTINGISFKHISAYCIGGSGGGGGGSGGAKGPPSHSGGNGSPGAVGGYAAIVQYPLTSDITLTLGAYGKNGVEGNTGSKSGNDGTPGGVGGTSTLIISGVPILSAGGGGGGNAGNNGNTGGDGNAGTLQPSDPSSVGAGGKNSTIATTPDAAVWPPNNSVAGVGGNRGAGDGSPAATPGTPGIPGSSQLWFSYVA